MKELILDLTHPTPLKVIKRVEPNRPAKDYNRWTKYIFQQVRKINKIE